jgi:hypothetical protein
VKVRRRESERCSSWPASIVPGPSVVSVAEEELRARIRGAEVAEWLLDPRVDLLPQVRIERSGAAFEATVALGGRELQGPT